MLATHKYLGTIQRYVEKNADAARSGQVTMMRNNVSVEVLVIIVATIAISWNAYGEESALDKEIAGCHAPLDECRTKCNKLYPRSTEEDYVKHYNCFEPCIEVYAKCYHDIHDKIRK